MSTQNTLRASLCLTLIAFGGCAKTTSTHSEVPHAEAHDPATPEPHEPAQQVKPQVDDQKPLSSKEDGSRGRPEPFDKTAITPLDDPQIAKITDTIHSGEIQQAELAKRRSRNPQVQQLAELMLRDHTRLQRDGATLSKEAAINPKESNVSSGLRDSSDETLTSLLKASGAEFDKQYIEAQVGEHENALRLLDQQLIPSAKSPALRSQLEAARTVASEHLTHAKNAQQELIGPR